jgi:serine protease inhibitor
MVWFDYAVMMPKPTVVEFVVDRPFVFVIYNTLLQCPLFVGQVLDPTAA